jgi:hypothetical protein
MKSDQSAVEALEGRLRELDRERLNVLDSLRTAKAEAHSPQRSLELDRREYPETPAARVALFEKIFVARRDVYPRLWENVHTGRKGYSPVCEAAYSPQAPCSAKALTSPVSTPCSWPCQYHSKAA